jgi:hypothetical protein
MAQSSRSGLGRNGATSTKILKCETIKHKKTSAGATDSHLVNHSLDGTLECECVVKNKARPTQQQITKLGSSPAPRNSETDMNMA